MATWIDVPGAYATYSGGCNYISLKVHLQYDADSASPNSITCRTKAYKTKNYSTTDTYFIYSKDGRISVICYLCSAVTSKDRPYYSNPFTIEKSLTDKFFKIPALKICNDGSYWPKSLYTDNNGRGADVYWNSGRTGYQTDLTNGKSTIETDAYVTNVKGGYCSIEDNGNNSYTVTGKGADGTTYNSIQSAWLTYTGGASRVSCINKVKKVVNLTDPTVRNTLSVTDATYTVKAQVVTTANYGDPETIVAGPVYVKNYQRPVWDSNAAVALDNSSLRNGRLTVKQNWKFTWDGALPVNNSSPIMGYTIAIYRKPTGSSSAASAILGLTCDFDDYTTASISRDASETYTSINLESSISAIEFNPVDMGFSPGDQVSVGVRPYTKNGQGTIIYGVELQSVARDVQNAGVMRVKVNTGTAEQPKHEWKEGVVYVKVNKNDIPTWVEADIVKVKTADGWKEST